MNNTKKSTPLTQELLNLANRGNLFLAQGRLDEAVKVYRKALVTKPDFAEVQNNLGVALHQQGKLDAAIECYQCALSINPKYPDAYQNIGLVLKDQGKPEASIEYFQRALSLRPNYADTYCNLGLAFKAMNKLDIAVQNQNKALSIKPDFAEAQVNLGLCQLSQGQLLAGWQSYEKRFDPQLKQKSNPVPFSFPRWQGESLEGKSIVVWTEQGLGDEIQFCRYVSVLKQQGAKQVTWVCKKPLKALLMTLDDVDSVVIEKEARAIPAHDYWIHTLSLPLYCQTTLETIPAKVPYLYEKSQQVQVIAKKLSCIGELKVGVCWKGNPQHTNDLNRSPGINAFKVLFEMSGVKFFNLQPDTRKEFIREGGKNAVDRGHEIDKPSFEEAAALIMNLDLVISCDTSVCHLAGALGKTVWIVLPYEADWRWMLNSEKSPWYPTARLFRQTKIGDWTEVFERVEKELQAMMMEKTANSSFESM